jgi:hypothetical protein
LHGKAELSCTVAGDSSLDTRAAAIQEPAPSPQKLSKYTLTAMIVASTAGVGIYSLPKNFGEAAAPVGDLTGGAIAGTSMHTLARCFRQPPSVNRTSTQKAFHRVICAAVRGPVSHPRGVATTDARENPRWS